MTSLVRAALGDLVAAGVDWGVRAGPPAGPTWPSAPTGTAVRPAAVLVLLGPRSASGTARGPEDLDLLVVERAASLRHHPGQIAFPGGRLDPEDDGPVAAALREAQEETGLDPAGVDVVGTLGGLALPVSNRVVTPVLAWWATPSPVAVVDAGECAAVLRVPVGELLDPANRRLARVTRGPRSHATPAFVVGQRVVWGFTGIVLDRVLDGLGWTRPWEPQVLDLPV